MTARDETDRRDAITREPPCHWCTHPVHLLPCDWCPCETGGQQLGIDTALGRM